MKRSTLTAAVALTAAALLWLAAGAFADSPASDAAQGCLQGSQREYYEVAGGDASGPSLDSASAPEIGFGCASAA